jgi:hypothetical protein
VPQPTAPPAACPSGKSYVSESPAPTDISSSRSSFYVGNMWQIICVNTREYNWNLNSKTMKLDLPQHNSIAVCVTAQQYSSAPFVLFRCLSRKVNFGVSSKNTVFNWF